MLVKIHISMNQFKTERLAYDGSDPSDDWIVTGIGHSKLNINNLQTVPIQSLDEYEAGCKLHDNCLGHVGKTDTGLLLPIQSLSVHTSTVSNDVLLAASQALGGTGKYHKEKYTEILKSSMKRKTGRMRKGIVNCHVDGSLRLIITPQWEFHTNVIAIPHYLEGIRKACRLNKSTNKYKTLPVANGDRAIVVRPPSLSARAVQPMVIQFWNHTCMGISPDILKAFEGDYDGDEMHVYPVYSDQAVEECMHWINTPNKTMIKAREILKTTPFAQSSSMPGEYMMYTTMSFNEIMNQAGVPLMAEETRTRMEHIIQFGERPLPSYFARGM